MPYRAIFALSLFLACSCVAGGGSDDASSGRYIPVIRGDACRAGTAVTLLPPDRGPLNDHTLIRDANGTWHLFAIADPCPDHPAY